MGCGNPKGTFSYPLKSLSGEGSVRTRMEYIRPVNLDTFLNSFFSILDFGFDLFGRIWVSMSFFNKLEVNFLRDFVWIMFLQSFQAIRKISGNLHSSVEFTGVSNFQTV